MTRPLHRHVSTDRTAVRLVAPRLLLGLVACLLAGCATTESFQPDEGVPIEILIIDPGMIDAPGHSTITFGYEEKTRAKLPQPPAKQWVSLFVLGKDKRLAKKPEQWHSFDAQTLTREVTIHASDYAVGKSGQVAIMVRAQDTTKELEKPLTIDGTTPVPPE